MKYLLFVTAEPVAFERMSTEEGKEFTRRCLAFDQHLADRGIFIDANALQPAREAVTVRKRDGKLSVTDGPFAETKEHLCGFIMVEAVDLNAAIKIAEESPFSTLGSVEVRPVMEISAN